MKLHSPYKKLPVRSCQHFYMEAARCLQHCCISSVIAGLRVVGEFLCSCFIAATSAVSAAFDRSQADVPAASSAGRLRSFMVEDSHDSEIFDLGDILLLLMS